MKIISGFSSSLAFLGASLLSVPNALATDWPCGSMAKTTVPAGTFEDAFPIHGVAGDQRVLFAVQPSAGLARPVGVHAVDRLTGHLSNDLTPPPQGFAVPLTAVITEFDTIGLFRTEGTLLVSDVRVPPGVALTNPAPAEIYSYHYEYQTNGTLVSSLDATWSLPVNTVAPGAGLPNGFLYLGSFAVLPNGAVVLTDTFTGGIWVASAFGAPPVLAMIDPRFSPAPVFSDILGIQRSPGGGFRNYAQRLPQIPGGPSIGPGIESITHATLTDEVCVTPTVNGGLYCIATAALFDLATPPFAKAPALRTVLAPTPGVSDLTDGLTYDRFHPTSRWLYWHRAPSDTTAFDGSGYNTLRRVDLLTGVYETVARTNICFDWTYEIAPLPPVFANSTLTTILSSMGQGPNNPEINMNLAGVAAYVAPSILPITVTPSN